MKVRPFKATEVVETPDGEFTLAIDMGIIDALEDEFDTRFDLIMEQFSDGGRIGRLARLIRGLLSRHHPNLTLDDVGALVMSYSDEFGKGMERLFAKAQPEAEEGANPPKPRRGARKASSQRGAVPA